MKKFFQKVSLFFKTFFSKVAKFFTEEGPEILRFLNAVKAVVDNPALSLAVAASKNQIDDLILFELRRWLGRAVDIMEIKLECGAKPTLEQKITCFVEHLRNCPPEIRNALYHKTASIIAREKAREQGVKLTTSEVDTLIQLEYSKLKANGNDK